MTGFTNSIDYGPTGVPTEQQTAEHLTLLLSTHIPYGYLSAQRKADHDHRDVASARPSNAREQWSYSNGIVTGYELTVQQMFAYPFVQQATALLRAAATLISADGPTR